MNHQTNTHVDSTQKKSAHKHASAKNHLLAFFVSIVLTIIAFIAVGSEFIKGSTVVPFILLLAVIQAAFQLFVWMHLDQKGHEFPKVGILTGAMFALIFIVGVICFMG